MKVMVKEAKNISTDVQYPELGNKHNGPSAQVVLPRELFTKYEGNSFFFHRANSSPVFHFSFISAYDVQNFHSAHKSVCRRAIEFFLSTWKSRLLCLLSLLRNTRTQPRSRRQRYREKRLNFAIFRNF